MIDCGSTHGTVCNKTPVETGKMIKLVPNNNVIKFGASTRIFILCSNEDVEPEQNTTGYVERPKNVIQNDNEDNGCSWGMQLTDCDDEAEETSDCLALKEIISAMKNGQSSLESANESVFSDNPYKCMQQWFEREEQDFDYNVENINGKFKCKFEIPIDGQWIPIEGDLMNRKKEAVSNACLKCCKILDQTLLLFPWQKQNAAKKSNNLYGDNDDDDLIDETVKTTKKLKKDYIENFESLNIRWKDINEELRGLKVKLATIGLEDGVKPELSDNLTDSLDIYLASMNQNKYGLTLNQKIEKSNLRIKIKQLEDEQLRIEKLMNLAKPVDISFAKMSSNVKTKEIPEPKQSNQIVHNGESECLEKQGSDQHIPPTSNCDMELSMRKKPINVDKSKSSKKIARKLKQNSIIEAIEREKQLENKKVNHLTECESDFVDWLPPSNQSGDGKTSLNDKFGY